MQTIIDTSGYVTHENLAAAEEKIIRQLRFGNRNSWSRADIQYLLHELINASWEDNDSNPVQELALQLAGSTPAVLYQEDHYSLLNHIYLITSVVADAAQDDAEHDDSFDKRIAQAYSQIAAATEWVP